MTNIYVETLSNIVDNQVIVTIETYVGLCVYKYVNGATHDIILNFVNLKKSCQIVGVTAHVKDVKYNLLPMEQFRKEIASLCNLPALVTNGNVVIAGLCGVCRGIIKAIPDETVKTLLGFKGSCLLAPAETSIWTKFCEIDFINCTKSLLQPSFYNSTNVELPPELGRFECHMSQPIRIHNVYKLARDLAKEKVQMQKNEQQLMKLTIDDSNNIPKESRKKEPRLNKTRKNKNSTQIDSNTPIEQLQLDHTFVEGQSITLADVIIYSCFKLIISAIPNVSSFKSCLPLTQKWIKSMELTESAMLNISPNSITNNNVQYSITLRHDESLYKIVSKPKGQIFTKQIDIDASLAKIKLINLNVSSTEELSQNTSFDWSSLPYEALPEGGQLPVKRLERKTHQLQSLAKEVLIMAKPGDRIVDFCSGAGHLGIIIAYRLPQCQIILLENKEESLQRAKVRCDLLKLKNVLFFQCNLDYFDGQFNIGCSLHACGVATDIVLSHCIRQKANFVCCPCCYGGIHDIPHITYPRSKCYRTEAEMTIREYMHLAHGADQTHNILTTANCNVEKSLQGEFCMDVVDWDRKLYAEDCGYEVVRLTRLQPEDCTPKNRLLIGIYNKNVYNN